MKRLATFFVLAITLFPSCTQSKKMQSYNQFKNEIVKGVFQEFERILPESYDNSTMAQIHYAPSYTSFGLSGIVVLFSLNNSDFIENIQKLHDVNIIPSELFDDTISLNHSHPEYFSINYNKTKVAFPRVNDDFCEVSDTCKPWKDLETLIFEVGTKKVFSNKIDPDYTPKNPNCNYSIGAFISRQKRQIVYWLYIYD